MQEADNDVERSACAPTPLHATGFNPRTELPYGLTIDHIQLAMLEFLSFLGFINQQLNTQKIERLETMLMAANFSSVVGDWLFSGRSATSRRTITASVTESGYQKMLANWVYNDFDVLQI